MTEGSEKADQFRIACFISPHGFGHAARASAVIEALNAYRPNCHFVIFTTVPPRFFEDSLSVSYSYFRLKTDIGLVQRSAFEEDLDQTLKSLNGFLPFDASAVSELSRSLVQDGCHLILCDIAPLGIAVGKHSGIPTILIENFTWDSIYAGYPTLATVMDHHIEYLRQVFATADHRIQTEPVCFRHHSDLMVGPVSRKFKSDRMEIRRKLGIPLSQKAVLISTGGIPERYRFIDRLATSQDVWFILPGGSQLFEIKDNVILLPHHSDFYHPDLVNACDVVIGKAGYSTIAEVYAAGVPFGYIPRRHYPETPGLIAYIERNIDSVALRMEDFISGQWIEELPRLLAIPRRQRSVGNGAEQIAAYISQAIAGTRSEVGIDGGEID